MARFTVPTFDGVTHDAKTLMPILATNKAQGGLRIVLGSHQLMSDCPDLLIERCPNGWRIILHPVSETDACGAVLIRDDGQSWLVTDHQARPHAIKEKCVPHIQVTDTSPEEFDTCVLFHCQNCGCRGDEDAFTPSDGQPAPYACPDCGRSDDCFPMN